MTANAQHLVIDGEEQCEDQGADEEYGSFATSICAGPCGPITFPRRAAP